MHEKVQRRKVLFDILTVNGMPLEMCIGILDGKTLATVINLQTSKTFLLDYIFGKKLVNFSAINILSYL